jgi:hypothetical protein
VLVAFFAIKILIAGPEQIGGFFAECGFVAFNRLWTVSGKNFAVSDFIC